jgi:hypothetical protein
MFRRYSEKVAQTLVDLRPKKPGAASGSDDEETEEVGDLVTGERVSAIFRVYYYYLYTHYGRAETICNKELHRGIDRLTNSISGQTET